jgi:autophagy-related protein 5
MATSDTGDTSESTTLPPPTLAIDRLRSANWSGSIPIQLSLAPQSLSSPTIPPPIHVLLSRHTFLHVGLREAVMRLNKFAPPTISFTRRVVEEPDPGSAQDSDLDTDANTEGEKQEGANLEQRAETAYPVCWFEDEATELPLRWQYFAGILWDTYQRTTENTGMPWKIRLHFTSYPSSQLLQLDASSGVLTTVERTFRNSLKQALVLEHGNAKVALNMSKQSSQRMWGSIVNSKYSIYKPIKEDIQAATDPILIPVRLLVGSSKPPIQKRCDDPGMNLGQFLHLRVPDYFESSSAGDIQRKMSNITWLVSGIAPPLSTRLLDLWRTLCHPDNFLYITIMME